MGETKSGGKAGERSENFRGSSENSLLAAVAKIRSCSDFFFFLRKIKRNFFFT